MRSFISSSNSDRIRIVPGNDAPVLTKSGIQLMRYGLIPHWSSVKNPKFSTYNARIETVDQKPSWKVPFEKFHCVVPISGFVEPIYESYWAGHMVEFYGSTVLFAAGIYDRWKSPQTEEFLESFAILMHTPSDFVSAIGHDRMPIFLNKNSAKLWVSETFSSSGESKEFLYTQKLDPLLEVRSDRVMKDGWKKRV